MDDVDQSAGDRGTVPLEGLLVVELANYLPGSFAAAELRRLGARAVKIEPPWGDAMRRLAPGWQRRLDAGKESVACDLKADPGLARAICARADVVLEGFRPGVARRLGIGPDDLPASIVYCSITGFGEGSRHAARVGHDLNYQGFAGALADTSPALPAVPAADVAAGSLGAVEEILAALVGRARTGRGTHIVVSMTHGVHRLIEHRLGGDPWPHTLTGGLACYRIYATADGRHVTLGALEPEFFTRLCTVLGRPELAALQFDLGAQERLAGELASAFGARTLADWLTTLDGEEVAVGPVATLEEAAADFGRPHAQAASPAPAVGEHTDAWRREVGLRPPGD